MKRILMAATTVLLGIAPLAAEAAPCRDAGMLSADGRIYTAKLGDNPWEIARVHLGEGIEWRQQLLAANPWLNERLDWSDDRLNARAQIDQCERFALPTVSKLFAPAGQQSLRKAGAIEAVGVQAEAAITAPKFEMGTGGWLALLAGLMFSGIAGVYAFKQQKRRRETENNLAQASVRVQSLSTQASEAQARRERLENVSPLESISDEQFGAMVRGARIRSSEEGEGPRFDKYGVTPDNIELGAVRALQAAYVQHYPSLPVPDYSFLRPEEVVRGTIVDTDGQQLSWLYADGTASPPTVPVQDQPDTHIAAWKAETTVDGQRLANFFHPVCNNGQCLRLEVDGGRVTFVPDEVQPDYHIPLTASSMEVAAVSPVEVVIAGRRMQLDFSGGPIETGHPGVHFRRRGGYVEIFDSYSGEALVRLPASEAPAEREQTAALFDLPNRVGDQSPLVLAEDGGRGEADPAFKQSDGFMMVGLPDIITGPDAISVPSKDQQFGGSEIAIVPGVADGRQASSSECEEAVAAD